MMSPFNPRKAAQVAAYLIRGRGGKTDLIDVIKLIYLADRTFMDEYDRPILFDRFYCMDHGPVNSETYDALKVPGKIEAPWSEYIKARRGNEMLLRRELTDDDFDELSMAEERVLRALLRKHKDRRSFALVDWIHKHCPEWSNPRGTSVPLLAFEIWKALGRENLDELNSHMNEMQWVAGAP